MKLVLAGSRRLPKGTATRLLRQLIFNLTEEDTVLIRGPMAREPGKFEMDVRDLCAGRRIPCQTRRPQPTERHPGRASVYVRDYEMVEDADLVALFFTPGDAATGYSGTAHLLDKALDAGVPVTAYSVYLDGSVVRIGEIDPE